MLSLMRKSRYVILLLVCSFEMNAAYMYKHTGSTTCAYWPCVSPESNFIYTSFEDAVNAQADAACKAAGPYVCANVYYYNPNRLSIWPLMETSGLYTYYAPRGYIESTDDSTCSGGGSFNSISGKCEVSVSEQGKKMLGNSICEMNAQVGGN